MSDERLKQLEKRVAELEAFKKTTERFIREYRMREILFESFDALELTAAFEGHTAGYYCKKCFMKNGEFKPLERIRANFQIQISDPMKNAVCPCCDTRTTFGTRGKPIFR